jgi:hypothetical protein
MKLLKTQHTPLLFGASGLLTCVSGTLLEPSLTQSLLFVAGSGLLAISAWIDSSLYFCLLSALAALSGLVGLLKVPTLIKVSMPLVGAAICFLVLRQKGLLDSFWQLYGGLGLLFLALGYAVVHPALYCTGGFVLCTFATVEFRKGVTIALYWAVLNLVFCGTSALAVYRLYMK